MSFEFKKCQIKGLYEIKPELYGDENCNLTENIFKRVLIKSDYLCSLFRIISLDLKRIIFTVCVFRKNYKENLFVRFLPKFIMLQ